MAFRGILIFMEQQVRNQLTTPEAARYSGLTRAHLVQLVRRGTLEGVRMGRDWFVYVDSLDRYLATPRRPGPRKLTTVPENKTT